ncbi:MAG: tandem-95 repeat protein [Pirellulaceae bacterium]|nr:tandem-95 repeat protein [Pirellulaceae bacterium]
MTRSRHSRRRLATRSPHPLRFEALEKRVLLAADLATEPDQAAVQSVAEGEAISSLGDFAQALADSGTKFFGSVLCTVCDRQKALFGQPADQPDHIEVLNPDGSLNAVGQAEGINATPTWEYPDGTRAEGFQSLDQLAEGSGVPLPTNIAVLKTNFGDVELVLQPQAAPLTVDNFLNYANDGDYDDSFFHRLAAGFVLQGGGFVTTNETFTSTLQFASIPTDPPVVNEFNLSNVAATVSMAKLGNDPNSATSQFFFNLLNNSENLDNQNGGFSVFATVNDMTVVNTMASVGTLNAGSPFDNLPISGDGRLLVINGVTGSGEIRGTVFGDDNVDGAQNGAEQGVAGATVFVDGNDNGNLDAGELSTTAAADGSYVITAGAGTHIVRQVLNANVAPTISDGRISVDVLIGRTTADVDFGEFTVPAVASLDLVNTSDTGPDDADNVTSRDNSAPGNAFDIFIPSAFDGALVRLFADNVQIAQATANSDVTISSGGSQTLSGNVVLSADQVVNGVAGPRTTQLSITIDAAINPISSTPPTDAKAGDDLNYNAQHDEEGSGLTYTLPTGPAGASINSATGVVTWVPTNAQEGSHNFNVVATDLAGNTTNQAFVVNAISNELIRVDFKTTDLAESEITSVDVGDSFLLQVFVSDRRIAPQGITGAFFDVLYQNDLVTPNGAAVFEDDFDADREFGDASQLGLIDEIGARSSGGAGSDGGSVLMFTIPMLANIAGTEIFSANGADDLPANDSSLVGQSPISPAEFKFNGASIAINASFGANGDLFGVDEDTVNASLDVLQNDQQFQSSTGDLIISAVGPTSAGGALSIAPDLKSLTYSPAANFFGKETFVYTLSNGSASDTGFVIVDVQSVNDPPNAVDDQFTVTEDSAQTSFDVLGNDDSSPDPPESFSITAVTAPDMGGDATIGAAGSIIRYQPAANFSGMETFSYTLTDTLGATKTAVVTVTVDPLNDPPNALNDTFNIDEDDPAADFKPLVNDTDAPDMGETLTITAISGGLPGATVQLVDGETIRYAPPADVFGSDIISYTISDGNGGEDSALINFMIASVNDNPIARDDSFTVVKNASVTGFDVLGNDDDAPDLDETLTIESFSQGNNGGVVSQGVNGQLNYQPPPDYSGPDEFTYAIGDGNGGMATATVMVTVRDFEPSSLGGSVFIDQNNNGLFDANEGALGGVTIQLTGTSPIQGAVNASVQTAADGSYAFINLPPGEYQINEVQPQFIADGMESLGTAGGSILANDRFGISVPEGTIGADYNFAELGRNSQATSLADFLVRQRRSVTGAARPSVETLTVNGVADWYSFGPGWLGFASAQSSLVQTNEISLAVEDGAGAVQTRNVSAPTAEVRLLAANETTFFARVTGDFTSIGFSAPGGSGGSGEAEAGSVEEIAAAFNEGSDQYVIGEGEPAFITESLLVVAPSPAQPVDNVEHLPPLVVLPVLELRPVDSLLAPPTDGSTNHYTAVADMANRGERIDAAIETAEFNSVPNAESIESIVAESTVAGVVSRDRYAVDVDTVLEDDTDELFGL